MRAYSINITGGSLTAAATTIIELTSGTNKAMLLTRAAVSQQGNTTSAQQAVAVSRQSTAGTNVSSPANSPMDAGDSAAGFTSRGLCTTQGTEGAILCPDSFNWQNGYVWLPVPEEREAITGAGILGFRTKTTPPAQTINAQLRALELG